MRNPVFFLCVCITGYPRHFAPFLLCSSSVSEYNSPRCAPRLIPVPHDTYEAKTGMPVPILHLHCLVGSVLASLPLVALLSSAIGPWIPRLPYASSWAPSSSQSSHPLCSKFVLPSSQRVLLRTIWPPITSAHRHEFQLTLLCT